MKKIRNLALALLKNNEGQFLLHQAYDSVKEEFFYRPLGGGIEYGELGKEALRREFMEEINTKIEVGNLLETFENIFTYEGKPGHEYILLYDCELTRPEDAQNEYQIIENGIVVGNAVWKSLDEIKIENSKLYPCGVNELMEKATGEKIAIHDYSGKWPLMFEEIKKKLQSCLDELAISIDHIGSTSVPGLAAKNRIDVQVSVKEISEDLKRKLDDGLASGGFSKSLSYEDHRPPGDDSDQKHWKKLYVSGKHKELDFNSNIHVREVGRNNQKYPLLFRDFLRSNSNSAKAYEMLKRELSRFHPYDLIAYCEIKDPACDLVISHAEEWAKETGWSVEKSMSN